MPNVLNEFAGDGVTKTFNFSMTGGYLSRDYVYFFTRPNDDLLNYTPYNDDDVTWLTDFSVRTANPIPVGTTFVILRSTTLDPLVDFQNTSRITEKNLDTATWQSVHIAAETSDTVSRIRVVAAASKQEAADAALNAKSAADSSVNAAASAMAASQSAGVAVSTANTAMSVATEAKELIDQAVSGAVVSFNGRAGGVTPQAGDYTKAMVGLGSVDNTPDLAKPISTATSNALGLKADSTAMSNALANKADTAAVNAALASNASADRNRANHTGTQPVATITGLGTAALLDVATGPEDMTTSRLQRVGAFGIGRMSDFRSPQVSVHGNLPPSSFFNVGTRFGMADGGVSPNNNGLSIPGLTPATYGVLVINGHYSDASARSAIQRWFFSGQRMWFSSAVSDSTWGGWTEVATQVNGSTLLPMLGNHQTWQLVDRAVDVTYYNTTPRPIVLNVAANGVNTTTEIIVQVGGAAIRIAGESSSYQPRVAGSIIIPPGSPYLIHITGGATTIDNCYELR